MFGSTWFFLQTMYKFSLPINIRKFNEWHDDIVTVYSNYNVL